MKTPRTRWAAVAALSLVAGLWAGMPAGAVNGGPVVVADGLNNPRQLAFSPGGGLYVAEAGYGGEAACTEHPEFGEVCFGYSGSVAKVGHGSVNRVVEGLPSAGEEDAIGPGDLVFTGNHQFALTIGLGGDLEYRDGFGEDLFGTVVTGDLRHPEDGVSIAFDALQYEADENPDGTDIDSNPVGIARWGNGWVVADAGANDVISTRKGGSTVAVLDPVLTTQPGPVPVGFKADAVPTDVVRGPDGAWYVSQLVGFPFEPGSSTIWRVRPGQAPQAYATGLTNVTSLAFADDGRLFAVQLATNGLLSGPPGSLVEVHPWSSSPSVVAGDLLFPYGVAISGNDAYVTTCTLCGEGAGSVVKIHLPN